MAIMEKFKSAIGAGQQLVRAGVEKVKSVGRSLGSWAKKAPAHIATVAAVTVVAGALMVMAEPAYAITCAGTSGLTACEWAKGVDFTDVTKAIGIITVALISLGLVIFGARMIIAWASGRRSGL